MENLEFGEKSTLYQGVLPSKKNGDAHHTCRGGPLKKLMGGGSVRLFNIGIFFTITLSQDFFFSSLSSLLESEGLYCCKLNLDTRHNLIVWNRLQTKY